MRIVVVLVVPCVGLSDFLHVAPQRGINVDLSVESLKHVFGDVAGVTHRRFFNQVGRIVGSNKVGELFEQRVCGGRSGYVLDVATEQVRIEDHALFSTLLVALDIIESAEFNCSCIAGGLIQGSIKGLFLLVGHVECVIRICSGGSRCSCCNRAGLIGLNVACLGSPGRIHCRLIFTCGHTESHCYGKSACEKSFGFIHF